MEMKKDNTSHRFKSQEALVHILRSSFASPFKPIGCSIPGPSLSEPHAPRQSGTKQSIFMLLICDVIGFYIQGALPNVSNARGIGTYYFEL